jgi:hypothetical protein
VGEDVIPAVLLVMPAQAGIHLRLTRKDLDARLRGHDRAQI